MDFSNEYTIEQEAFAKEVRAWLDANVPKDLIKPRDIHKMSREQWQQRREFGRKLGEKGWLYPQYPSEYGGGGLGGDQSAVIYQELANREISLPPTYDSGRLAVPTVMVCGTEEQKKRFLPPIFKGEAITWQLFTEPEVGTDEASQQARAIRSVKEKDHFIVNGSKIFIGGFYAPPEQFLLLTKSDMEAPRHQNLAMFLVPSNLPGITITPLDLFPDGTISQACYETTGETPGTKHSIYFEDVKIPESYLIGGEREGWRVANATLTVEHGDKDSDSSAKGAFYIPRNVLMERFLDQCRTNPNIKQRLLQNPQLQSDMVDLYIGAEIDRLFMIRNAALPRSGKRIPFGGPQKTLFMKLFGANLTGYMARVLGPYALTSDDAWGMAEGLFEVCERSGLCTAPGGTPEALKIVLSRTLRIGK